MSVQLMMYNWCIYIQCSVMMYNSRIVKFTKVFTFQNILQLPKDILSPSAVTPHSVLPSPWQQEPTLWVCGSSCSGRFLSVESHPVSFCVCVSHWASGSGSIHVVASVRASPLFRAEWCSHVWMEGPHLFVHLYVGGCLCHFHVLASTNVLLSMPMCVSVFM